MLKDLPKILKDTAKAAAKEATTVAIAASEENKATAKSQEIPRRPVQCHFSNGPHLRRDCPLLQAKRADPKVKEKCFRCRQPGHHAQNCRAGAPRFPCPHCKKGNHWLYDCRIRRAEQARETPSNKQTSN